MPELGTVLCGCAEALTLIPVIRGCSAFSSIDALLSGTPGVLFSLTSIFSFTGSFFYHLQIRQKDLISVLVDS